MRIVPTPFDSVFAVGPYPPPVHGASLATAAFIDRLQRAGCNIVRINTAAHSLNRSIIARATKVPRVLRGLAAAVRMASRPRTLLYLSVAGGAGQIYDGIFIGIFRASGNAIVLHHHSYAYLTKMRFVTRVVLRIAGKSATHIALCRDMRERLQQYGISSSRIVVLSNAFAVDDRNDDIRHARKTILTTLGFLSNISSAKGIFEFLRVFGELSAVQESVRAVIAGTFQDAGLERQVRQILNTMPNAQYVGPVYGDAKEMFFSKVDVLVFPTKYINEAEPLTIHEAMAHGVPVIAWARGCIPSMVSEPAGKLIGNDEDFVAVAVRQVKEWMASPVSFREVSEAARERFLNKRREAEHSTLAISTHVFSEGTVSEESRS